MHSIASLDHPPSLPALIPSPSPPAEQDCLAGLMLGQRRADSMEDDEERRAAATVRAVMRKLLTGGWGGGGSAARGRVPMGGPLLLLPY